ncbi:MAG TPA: DUF4347 domain-containing protein, partial [Azospirillaceae bacterium]|nr:DUF4347 domain-containing protein [Azospirillaceae bacterium]
MRKSPIAVLALEPRFMFDAAGVATAAETLNDPPPPDGSTQEIAAADSRAIVAADAPAAHDGEPAVNVDTPAYQEIRPADPDANQGKKEVVFIENNVADYQTLIDGVKPGVEVVLLDARGDGLAQMADWAAGKSGYDAIHVVSHGAEGQINLGALTLDTGTAVDRAADLTTLGGALTENGDLLLYGCSVASGEGEGFIAVMAARTGADVAASDDLTGAALLGGDWQLESVFGEIDRVDAIDLASIERFNNLLANPSTGTTNFNSATTTGLANGNGTTTVSATDVFSTGWDFSATSPVNTSNSNILRGSSTG